jgi:3-dehydroquinate synthase
MVIPVRLGARSYDVVVQRDALATVGSRLAALGVGAAAALVSDRTIRALHGESVAKGLAQAGFAVTELDVPEGETAKTLAEAERVWDGLLAAGLDRSSTVVALGGGAVGDLAGFAAATYMRGVNFVQVPTTLLAQIDASVGGKTAIDHPRAKNLIGAFHQPRLVVIDPAVLATLPEREFRSGLAEMVKHGIVLDADYFAELERETAAILARDPDVLARVIARSVELKAAVVERDEQEAELRAVLNYGHTIGHALEAVTGYAHWTHGEAVSLGIAAEARLARRIGVAAGDSVARQETLLRALGLPVRLERIDAEAVLTAIGRDKKSRNGRVPFVLAPRLGTFRLVHDVRPDDVRGALAELTA